MMKIIPAMLDRKYGKRAKGFTLIELLVVVVIIGILAAIAVPIYLNQRVVAWKATVVSDVHNAAKQVELASYQGDGSLTRLSDYRVKPADDNTTGGSPTIIADKTFANADGKYDGHAAKQVELTSYHGDGSLTQLSDYRVKPADDTTGGSPTIIADKTFANADGKYDGHGTIGSVPVSVSEGNTTEIQVKSDNSYTIYGANAHVNGWVYRYDSAHGAGEWEPGSYPSDPSVDPSVDCHVSLDGTKLVIGADGMRCRLGTSMVNAVIGGRWSTDRDAITEIDLHGHIVIVDGANLFYAMTSLTSMPYMDGQSVTSSVNGVSYSEMFEDDAKLEQAESISHWDTRNVTDMSGMFWNAEAFNQPISNFNTSKVTTMNDMFREAYAFNQPISNFNTSKVTNMSGMFGYALAFNQPVSNFDTRNVTDMSHMFSSAKAFNQSVSNFNTSKVTDMSHMFNGAQAFNQPVPFDTRNVTNMCGMFYNAYSFNQSVSSFDTRNVTDMNRMFKDARAFNQPVSSFDTSNVTNMSGMFSYASAFNQPVSNFDTGKVTSMDSMFDGASVFNQSVSFDTRNVTDMTWMFHGANAFNQDLTGWNVDNVTSHYDFNVGSALTADHLPHFKS